MYWFDTIVYCNMISTVALVALANTFTMPHNYQFFLCSEQLRSSFSEKAKGLIPM